VIKYALLLALSLVFTACGGNKKGQVGTTSTPAPTTAILVPNLRTGLTPDPPGVVAGPPPLQAQNPADQNAQGKLIGNFSDLDKIPLAYITFKDTPEWCSGILVSDETADSYIVVTAAHCFWDDKNKFYEPRHVYLLSKTGNWRRTEHVFYERSDIEDSEYKDIGLIRLKNKPPIDTNPPIPIGVRAVSPDPNAQAIWESKELKVGTEVYSWGYTSRRWTKRTTIAMTGAKIWGDPAGRDMRRWVIPTKYQQAYGGDSGGPLVMKINGNWHLVGVLQGYKPEGLYTDEQTITYTWVDGFMQNIWDANGNVQSKGMAWPETLNASLLQNY